MLSKRIPDLETYMHTTADRWRWRAAAGTDTQDIVDMALAHFGRETDSVYVNDPIEYSRNVTLAIVNQFYNPKAELFSVARDAETNQLLAYTWAIRNERAPWSREEMVAIRMAHCDLAISIRERVYLCSQMIRMWEKWARACEINIIVSSTIRSDQEAFLRLHESAGYRVNGSIGYKRLNNVIMDIEEGPDIAVTRASTSYDASKYSRDTEDHTTDSADRRV